MAGNRYIYLSGTDKVIRAKLGKVGVHCVKTQQGKCYSTSFRKLDSDLLGGGESILHSYFPRSFLVRKSEERMMFHPPDGLEARFV